MSKIRVKHNDLIEIIDAQKQIIEEYKRKIGVLTEQNELQSRLISQLERIAKNVMEGANEDN